MEDFRIMRNTIMLQECERCGTMARYLAKCSIEPYKNARLCKRCINALQTEKHALRDRKVVKPKEIK
jgi:hypothetical protein